MDSFEQWAYEAFAPGAPTKAMVAYAVKQRRAELYRRQRASVTAKKRAARRRDKVNRKAGRR